MPAPPYKTRSKRGKLRKIATGLRPKVGKRLRGPNLPAPKFDPNTKNYKAGPNLPPPKFNPNTKAYKGRKKRPKKSPRRNVFTDVG